MEYPFDSQNLAVLNAYVALSTALALAGQPQPAMPQGMVYWTVNPQHMISGHPYQPNGLGAYNENGDIPCAQCGLPKGTHTDQGAP